VTGIVWGVIGGLLVLLLLVSWLMDVSAKKRGARTITSKDISSAVRDGRRDAAVINDAGPLLPKDVGWTSWSRRGR